MALLLMGDVIDRVGVLLDDPSHRTFKKDYLRPHIDQQNESLMLDLEALGVQYQQQIAVFNLPVDVSDLTPYYATGQPLQYLMRPTLVEWKLQSQPDINYTESVPVKKLADVLPSNVGCGEYVWSGGVIQVTPSGTAVTLRITFLALTASVYDSAANVMRGIGFILASEAAWFIAGLNKGMGSIQVTLEKQKRRDRIRLAKILVQQQQGMLIVPQGSRTATSVQISAGGAPYS